MLLFESKPVMVFRMVVFVIFLSVTFVEKAAFDHKYEVCPISNPSGAS